VVQRAQAAVAKGLTVEDMFGQKDSVSRVKAQQHAAVEHRLLCAKLAFLKKDGQWVRLAWCNAQQRARLFRELDLEVALSMNRGATKRFVDRVVEREIEDLAGEWQRFLA
jgi:hypothetical protein